MSMEQPPGYYSIYESSRYDFEVYGRFAWVDDKTTPINVIGYDIQSYVVEGERGLPLSKHNGRNGLLSISEYIGPATANCIENTEVIIIYLDELASISHLEELQKRDNHKFIEVLIQQLNISLVHELCHWAIESNKQPDSIQHSSDWNRVIMELQFDRQQRY